VTKWRAVVLCGAVLFAAMPNVGCGSSERVVVSAPSSVPIEASSGAFGPVLPREGTSTPITVTALVGGTACPTLQFMVSTYTFKVSATTQYAGGACSNIQAGSRITFTGTRESSASQIFNVATLTFASTTAPPPSTPPPPTPVQAEGTITAIGAGACPELQFFIGSYALNVSYATQYTGGACADLRVGARVALVGTKRDTESFVRITAVTFRHDGSGPPPPTNPAPPTNPSGRPVEGEGVITTLRSGSSCPALTFYIDQYVITLDANTLFDRGACGDLATGVRVHVVGTIANNAVSAARIAVQAETPGRPVVEGEGRVTRLVSGTICPALTFMIEEYSVSVNASTVFVGGACGDVAAGRKLGVQGVATGERQVLATKIVFKNAGD
jgi:uncharacterized protein DUF5666